MVELRIESITTDVGVALWVVGSTKQKQGAISTLMGICRLLWDASVCCVTVSVSAWRMMMTMNVRGEAVCNSGQKSVKPQRTRTTTRTM